MSTYYLYCIGSPPKVEIPMDRDDPESTPETLTPAFSWTQSSDSPESCLLNLLVHLLDRQTKPEVEVACISGLYLNIKVDGVVLCNAKLFSPVRPDATLWTYDRETNKFAICIYICV